MFAGYIGSSNETIILQDFFRTLPVIIENRVVQTEWSLVIKLSNQIFKVIYFVQQVVFSYSLTVFLSVTIHVTLRNFFSSILRTILMKTLEK